MISATSDFKDTRFQVWGAIDRVSLREFYARSLVLVVPSDREQFGMVAAEAMFCGCPVIASRIGGLQDFIINNVTGNLVDSDNIEQFASVLATYLRSPEMVKYKSINSVYWARLSLTSSVNYRIMENVYQYGNHDGNVYLSNSQKEFYQARILDLVKSLEKSLGERIQDLTVIYTRSNTSAVLSQGANRLYLKLFPNRPNSFHWLYPVEHDWIQDEPAGLKLAKEKFFAEAGLSVDIVYENPTTGCFVQHFANFDDQQATQDHGEDTLLGILSTIESLGNHQLVSAASDELTALFEHPSADDIGDLLSATDTIACKLNQHLVGGNLRAQVCAFHPTIELVRMRQAIDGGWWALPKTLEIRINGLIQALIDRKPLTSGNIRLSHGSLKPEHIGQHNGKMVLCDFEHARYTSGPFDLAHWYSEQVYQLGAAPVVTKLAGLSISRSDFLLGIQWLAWIKINEQIYNYCTGKPKVCEQFMRFASDMIIETNKYHLFS